MEDFSSLTAIKPSHPALEGEVLIAGLPGIPSSQFQVRSCFLIISDGGVLVASRFPLLSSYRPLLSDV